MFTVDLRAAKEGLSARVAALRNEVVQACAADHREELEGQVKRYNAIVDRLELEPTTSEELVALMKYQQDCPLLLDDLFDEYTSQAMERQRFLLDNGL